MVVLPSRRASDAASKAEWSDHSIKVHIERITTVCHQACVVGILLGVLLCCVVLCCGESSGEEHRGKRWFG